MSSDSAFLEQRADSKHQPHRWRIALAATCTITLWAAAFVAIRAALIGYSPAPLAALRFLLASAVLGVYALAVRMPLPQRRDLPQIVACGAIGITLYNLALNTGERGVSAGAASLLVSTSPLWTALLATVILRERSTRRIWLGMAVSFAGAILIALGEGGGIALNRSAGLVLVAALAQSAFFILQKPLLSRYTPVQCATYVIWAGTLALLPFAADLPAQIQTAPLSATLAVCFLGAGPAALAYATWAIVLAVLPTARAASLLYLIPGIALVIGWLWLGELPAATALVGGLFAIGGVILSRSKPRGR